MHDLTLSITSLICLLMLTCSGAAEVVWEYDVELDSDESVLLVEASFSEGVPRRLSLQTGAEKFVIAPSLNRSGVWTELAKEGDSWYLPQGGPYKLRYQFQVREAVESIEDWRFASTAGRVMIAQPSVWMLRPLGSSPEDEVRFRVRTPNNLRFVSGISLSEDGYRIACRRLAFAPISAFGPFVVKRVLSDNGVVLIAFDPEQFSQSSDELFGWVKQTTAEVADYLDGLSVPRTLILLLSSSRTQGRTQGVGGASIALRVNRRASYSELVSDWTLRHELLHLAHPSLPSHRWFEEGLAVYCEFAIRLSNGDLEPEDFWGELARRLPEGQEAFELGLDRSEEASHIYWGGTLFFLLADFQIRYETKNRKTIHDAIRAWHRAGGNVTVPWPLDRVLDLADKATGTSTFNNLYDSNVHNNAGVGDLDSFWERMRESGLRKMIESGDGA